MAHKLFVDRTEIRIASGNGGAGVVYFNFERKPTGGNGGSGGDVYIVGNEHKYDLRYFDYRKLYEAVPGESGGRSLLTGANGQDLIIEVPLVTNIYSDDSRLITRVERPGQKVLLAKGGRGGLGNHFFRKGGVPTLHKATPGRQGEELLIKLELELQSDALLIGLPNAGKSSLLNEITQAHAKVGAYAFTTLVPQLGMIDDLIVMDLPGLIEETHLGKGVGGSFVKHTRAARLVIHCIDVSSPDILGDYRLVRSELDLLSTDLAAKPELILITKSDLINPSLHTALIKDFCDQAHIDREDIFLFSLYDLIAQDKLKQEIKKRLIK